MSFAHTISKGFAWTTAGTVVGKVVVFANIFLILHQLSVYEYGLAELVFSVVSTIGLFLLPGLAATITADLGVERAQKEYGKMRALFSEFFLLNVALGVCAWAILFFGSTIVAEWSGNILIDKFFKIVSFSFLISPFRGVTTMLATVMVRYADQSFMSVVEELAKSGFLLLFFFVFDYGAAGLLWASVLAPLAMVLIFLPRTLSAYREFSHAAPIDQQPLWNILRDHRKWGVLSSYVGTLSGNARLWIIKLLLGTEAVGLFAFAMGIFGQIAGLISIQPALAPVIPRYVHHEGNMLPRLLRTAAKYQILISCAAFLGALLVIPMIVMLVFPHYQSAIPLVVLMMVALVPNGVASLTSPVFSAIKEQRTALYSVVLKSVSIAVLLPLSVVSVGLVGIGIEFVLTSLLTACERWYRVVQFIPGSSIKLSHFRSFEPEERNFIRDIIRKSGLHGIYSFFIR